MFKTNIEYIEKSKYKSKLDIFRNPKIYERVNDNKRKYENTKENVAPQIERYKCDSQDSTEISNEELKGIVENGIKKSIKEIKVEEEEETVEIITEIKPNREVTNNNNKIFGESGDKSAKNNILDLVESEDNEDKDQTVPLTLWEIHNGNKLSIGSIPKFSPENVESENQFWMYNYKYFSKDPHVETKYNFKKGSLEEIINDTKMLTECHVDNYYGFVMNHHLFVSNKNCINVSCEMMRVVDYNLRTSGKELSKLVCSLFLDTIGSDIEHPPVIDIDPEKDKNLLLSIVAYFTMNTSNSRMSNTKKFYRDEEKRLFDSICSNKKLLSIFENKSSNVGDLLQKTKTLIADKSKAPSFFYILKKNYSGWYMVHLIGLMIKEKMKERGMDRSEDKFYVFIPIYTQSGKNTMFDLTKSIKMDGHSRRIGHFTLLLIEIEPRTKTYQAIHIDSFSVTNGKSLITDYYNFISECLKLSVGLNCKSDLIFKNSGWQKDQDTWNCGYFCCYTGFSIMRHEGDKTKWINEMHLKENRCKDFYFCQFKKMVNTIEKIGQL